MVRFLIMDVDGTLTDGKIYIGQQGEVMKAFNVKDGYAISVALPEHNITAVIITGRESRIVALRCRELGIVECHQRVNDKLQCLHSLLQRYGQQDKTTYGLSDVAYIGDDLTDYDCMRAIKEAGGYVGCPADAVTQIKQMADFVSTKNGGDGAVREYIEWLLNVSRS